MERVVNIIGSGSSAKSAPDTGENWGINTAFVFAKMDKLFFMDGLEAICQYDKSNKEKYDLTVADAIKKYPDMQLISKNGFDQVIMNEDGTPLMRGDNPPKVAMITPYPLEAALDLCPGAFFTSSIAFAICYAIIEKVDRIRMYGMEIWSGSEANEYNYQRPCIDFWLAFAMGRGIKVECPWYLLNTVKNNQNLYGFVNPEELKGRF